MGTLVRIGQAAREMGGHPCTLKRWEQAGLLHAERSPGNVRSYRQSELQALWLRREAKGQRAESEATA